MRRKPYSVVLFDEIEKAHPDVFNVLLQVLDDGRLTDNKGRTANFKNTIIIMTSNMGSQLICENIEQAQGKGKIAKEKIMEQTKNDVLDLLKKTIRPEFLNRIDETIMFTPLDESEIRSIVQLQLNIVKRQLAENGIELQFTDAAINLIAEEGFDPQYGARPVKRVIQRHVLNPLSKDILAGKINHGKPVLVDAVEGLLWFSN